MNFKNTLSLIIFTIVILLVIHQRAEAQEAPCSCCVYKSDYVYTKEIKIKDKLTCWDIWNMCHDPHCPEPDKDKNLNCNYEVDFNSSIVIRETTYNITTCVKNPEEQYDEECDTNDPNFVSQIDGGGIFTPAKTIDFYPNSQFTCTIYFDPKCDFSSCLQACLIPLIGPAPPCILNYFKQQITDHGTYSWGYLECKLEGA